MQKCCKNCGNVIAYFRNPYGTVYKYECANGKSVSEKGICDRWQPNVTVAELGRRMDKQSNRLEKMKFDEPFSLVERPAYMTNYRIIGDEK